MIATFTPCKLAGVIDAPPSKSMAHRYLIGAALSGKVCTLSGVDYSEDILASMDCLKALGAKISIQGDRVTVDPSGFMQVDAPVLECRESGSTLRFFIPLALCLGKTVILRGSQRLMERPLKVYEDLCADNGFFFHKTAETVTLCGRLESGDYAIRGDVSSQFITGMIFALVYLGQVATIRILPPFESRSYVNLTISALNAFGADVRFTDDYTVSVASSTMHSYTGRIEGDYSNAAFLDAFNLIGSEVHVENLNVDSLQGDRVYRDYFRQLSQGTPTLDISDCPDLGPVLFALAALNHGAVFTGTDRLKVKESDRGQAMYEELEKLGGGLLFGDNTITVPKQNLQYGGIPLNGHNDHRVVMAMSIVLSVIGGSIDQAEAVRKSYPGFFSDIQSLGAKVELS
ncbi:MAG: 3-phosphoshikimate 1-carboxyvinyltransferase [Oscillospiraceae bacterium]|nr:3-phosphoshikimate 1-carboxyvinyltransferase [Oscillospiraceae bacterium]